MLFDEPTSALDPELSNEVLTVMDELVDEGMTMVVVTHEMRFARGAASGITFLADGRSSSGGRPNDCSRTPPTSGPRSSSRTSATTMTEGTDVTTATERDPVAGTESRPTARDRLRSSFDRAGHLLAVFAGIVFWGWLLTRWLYDWVFARLGIGPGAGEAFLSPAPFEALAASLSSAAGSFGPLGVPIGWLASAADAAALGVEIGPALATGAWYTVLLTLSSLTLGFCIAVPLAILRVYGGPVRWLALAYTELIRGTPLLAQLFVLYYGMPLSAWLNDFSIVGRGFVPGYAFWIAILGFTINGSAYQAEYIRGALETVDEGQLTAARAIGLSKFEASATSSCHRRCGTRFRPGRTNSSTSSSTPRWPDSSRCPNCTIAATTSPPRPSSTRRSSGCSRSSISAWCCRRRTSWAAWNVTSQFRDSAVPKVANRSDRVAPSLSVRRSSPPYSSTPRTDSRPRPRERLRVR